ncbi:formylmethanofuran dehydrogenase [Paraburkholderia sp. EG287B]|uniref:formylmethanofuran dehydrogenase n=1 Tax=Paraburkholderia sp. EG287B TaxID=3237010 RepID=UPI0034D1CC0C
MDATLHSPPWTCPFCALLCDRFSVARGETLTPAGTSCPRAARGLAQFGATPSSATPMLNGQPADAPTALDTAAQWLARARQPLFGGMATDVAGARALYRLANACGAIVDHAHGRSLMHGLTALQDRGAFTTTLAEIRNRADLIVCIGASPSVRYPEFFARCAVGADAAGVGPAHRTVVFFGCEADPALASRADVEALTVPLQGDLYDALATTNALLNGKSPRETSVSSMAALTSLIERMRAADYTAIVWTPADLPGPHAALLVEGFDRLLKTLNRTRRAGGLALGGDDGGASVNQTLTWLSGLPLRTGVHRSGLEHAPQRYDTARLLADHAVDALVWVASFGADLPPPRTAVPTIVLGHPGLAAACADRAGPTLFVPVSTPGIGSPGHLFRADGGVVLPLTPVYEDTLPTVAAFAATLGEKLASRRENAA